jgi:uncharacterized protein involved in exopolysaccharide biosynthesis
MIQAKTDSPSRRSWFGGLLGPVKLGCFAAFLVALAAIAVPNYYRSTAQILPVETRSMGGGGAGGLGNLATAAAAMGLGIPSMDSADANFVDIVKSRRVREKILDTRFKFKTRSWMFGAPVEHDETLAEFFHARNPDAGVARVGALMTTARDLKSRMMTVAAETTSPELSQAIVRASLEQLEAFLQEKGRTRGGAKALFAEARLADARKELAGAEVEFGNFVTRNRGYSTSMDPVVRLEGLRLEAEFRLRQQLVMTLAVNHEQAHMEEKNDIPLLNVLDPPDLPVTKSRPSRLAWVIMAFLFVTIGAWFYVNRTWLKERFIEEDPGPSGPPS